MKLYRTELDKGINKKLFDIDINQFQLNELVFYKDSIKVELSAERNSNGYRISGFLNIPFEQTCDRCLVSFHDLKKVEFNFWITDENELLQGNSDDVVYFSKDDVEIDLKTLFQELIFLEKQMKTICNDECKGLCSNCGANLNDGNCTCSIETKDNPWKTLKNLIGN